MKTILVTGATGYIGGRLIPTLIEKGYRVRCMVRDEKKIYSRDWYPAVEVVCADVFDIPSLEKAMLGIDAAYYLIHSMSAGKNFHEQDLLAAKNFGRSAKKAGVNQLVYLGGLGNPASNLSQHLRSRQATGDVLRQSNVAVTEFRAAVIVGSGSLSFEMIRYLTERVPVMICPSWVYTKTQPLAISDVISYLVSALETRECLDKIIEIGGSDVITYRQMMFGYAKSRGLRRLMIPVPVLTPRLSSYWVHLVTPIPSSIAQPLIDGLKNEVIVTNNHAQKIFPSIRPRSYEDAVRLALARLQDGKIENSWSDAVSNTQVQGTPVMLTTQEGMIRERRQLLVKASPEALYQTITSLGGQKGWLYMNWAWRFRGLLDTLLGGVGMRSGRRDPNRLRTGDTVDFWRVEAIKPNQFLRLRAEMKVPGNAWLQFEISPNKNNSNTLIQTAFFAPKGLFGILYWYILYPIHCLIFRGLIRNIAQQAQ
jgi:uncharacterized protein YbjT (DUF2867 family)